METPVEFHDKVADNWRDAYKKPGMRMRVEAIEHFLSDRLESQHWLDAGCGSGVLTGTLLNRGCQVDCADGSAQMIKNASATLESFGDQVAFQEITTIESLPYGDNSFNGILCSSVLEYLDDPMIALQEFGRVLKDDGVLLVSVPNRNSLLRRLHKLSYQATKLIGKPRPAYIVHSKQDYSVKSFGEVLKHTGFQTQQTRLIGADGCPAILGPVVHSVIFFQAKKRSVSE